MIFPQKTFFGAGGLFLAGLAAGFLLGSFFASPLVGCTENDLTPLPDTRFLDSEEAFFPPPPHPSLPLNRRNGSV